jgi:UDP-N-acetyl-D-mannosaminuronate dehydrogenase
MSDRKKVVLVIGLGEVGKPLYSILKAAVPDVKGVDADSAEVTEPVGIMHICFPYVNAEQFLGTVGVYARKHAPELIVINSTVVPGTTRGIENACGIPCVYSPVRGKHTKMAEELRSYVKFVAGNDEKAVARAMDHFAAAGMKTERMSSLENLELAKLLETTYFGLLIGWAQEMNRFAEKVNGNYLEIGKFFSEIDYLPKVLFQPGYIGGHCVMPNIALLEQKFRSDFLDAVKNSNELRRMELTVMGAKPSTERLQPLPMTQEVAAGK